jgi:hypothetical protein
LKVGADGGRKTTLSMEGTRKMANMCLLHQSKLDAFQYYLHKHGWAIMTPRGDWEVLRAINPQGKLLIVYRRANATEHYSVRDQDVLIVKKFLRGAEDGK